MLDSHILTNVPLSAKQRHALAAEAISRARNGEQSVCNWSTGVQIAGECDKTSIEKAIRALIARHAVLRTAITPNDGTNGQRSGEPDPHTAHLAGAARYSQCIRPSESLAVTVTHLGELESGQGLSTIVEHFSMTPFDYGSPPLLRAGVVRIGDREQIVVLVMPAIACDRRSLMVVRDEMLSLLTDAQVALERRSEADYIQLIGAEHDLLESGACEESVQYWTNQWGEYRHWQLAIADLPSALPPTMVGSISTFVETERLKIGTHIVETIRAIADGVGVTAETLYCAAFVIAMSRHTCKVRLPIWITLPNRPMGAERVVGWLSNSHMLGCDLCEARTIRDVVDVVRLAITGAYAHQAMPLSHLWSRVGVLDSGVKVSFEYTETTRFGEKADNCNECRVSTIELPGRRRWSHICEMNVHRECDEADAILSYSPTSFAARSMRSILEHFDRAIDDIAQGDKWYEEVNLI